MIIKLSKMAHFFVFCWWQQKNSQLGKIFKCIWKISFSSFRKCFELPGSKLPSARCQPLKVHDFVLYYWLASFQKGFVLILWLIIVVTIVWLYYSYWFIKLICSVLFNWLVDTDYLLINLFYVIGLFLVFF